MIGVPKFPNVAFERAVTGFFPWTVNKSLHRATLQIAFKCRILWICHWEGQQKFAGSPDLRIMTRKRNFDLI